MTYANLDEAFGSSFNRCEEPPKKSEKFNCNKDKNSFSVNKRDRETDTRNINLPEGDNGNLNNSYDTNNFAIYSNEPQNNNLLENFENPKPNQNNNKQKINEIYEYSEEENKLIDFASDVETEPEPEPEPEQEVKTKPKKRKNKREQVNNSQIVEINNKMNFIIDQLNNNNNVSDSNENNIHDIVLFILFGVFVIVILESLYKLVVKLCRYKMFNQ